MGRKLLGSSLSDSSDEITFGSKVDLKKVWKQAEKEGLTYDISASGVLSVNNRVGDIRIERKDVEPFAGVISFEGRQGDITLRESDISNLTNIVNSFNGRSGDVELKEEDCVISLNGRYGNVELIHDDIKALIPSGNGVESFNGRLGDVVLTQDDIFKTLMADGLPNGVGVYSDKTGKININGGEQTLTVKASDKATLIEFNSPKKQAPFHIKDGKSDTKYLTIYENSVELSNVERIKWSNLEEIVFSTEIKNVYRQKIGFDSEHCTVKIEVCSQDIETKKVSFRTDLLTSGENGFDTELAYLTGDRLSTAWLESINGELIVCIECTRPCKVTAKVQKFTF